jgi:hypothetical protein
VAFTESEKVQIRKWTGWPERFLQVDSALERAMSAVEDTRLEAVVEVRSLLAQIETIRLEIIAARRRRKALAVGTIELSGEGETGSLWMDGTVLSKQLATIFGVEMRTNPWFPGSAQIRSGWDGPSGGGGALPFG